MKNKPYKRRLPIRSISNFRDLGGYRTADGQHQVRWRTLFRSGHLNRLRGIDIDRFNALKIGTVIDFRAQREKDKEPDQLPEGSPIERIELPILDEGNSEMMKELRRRFEANDLEGLDTEALMAYAYQQFPLQFGDEYRQFVQALLESNGQPVLWHCTAGKDRAGFAAALTLRLLGVPMETIVEDYLLSGKYSKPPLRLAATLLLFRGIKAYRLIKTMYDVEAEWIQNSFAAIEEQWGSFDAFAHNALALSDADIARLRELYLEPVD